MTETKTIHDAGSQTVVPGSRVRSRLAWFGSRGHSTPPAIEPLMRALRANHPKAVESREKALKIWQDASLKMTQAEIGRTDSALQATIAQYGAEKDLYRKNMLRVKRDSLQVRYDALCGTVRVIHKRQAED